MSRWHDSHEAEPTNCRGVAGVVEDSADREVLHAVITIAHTSTVKAAASIDPFVIRSLAVSHRFWSHSDRAASTSSRSIITWRERSHRWSFCNGARAQLKKLATAFRTAIEQTGARPKTTAAQR